MNEIESREELLEQASGWLKEAVLLIPNLIKLLYNLMQDASVPKADKVLLVGTIAYVLSPLDFLPDMIPFLGQVDDLLLMALVIKRLMDNVSHEILMEYWDGNRELLTMVETILNYTVLLLPPAVYRRVVKKSQQ